MNETKWFFFFFFCFLIFFLKIQSSGRPVPKNGARKLLSADKRKGLYSNDKTTTTTRKEKISSTAHKNEWWYLVVCVCVCVCVQYIITHTCHGRCFGFVYHPMPTKEELLGFLLISTNDIPPLPLPRVYEWGMRKFCEQNNNFLIDIFFRKTKGDLFNHVRTG